MKKFEFVLYINGNIVVQRYFTVKDFNKDSIRSLDIKYCVDNCVRMIENNLKEKTFEYLYKSYNPYKEQLQEEIKRAVSWNKWLKELWDSAEKL